MDKVQFLNMLKESNIDFLTDEPMSRHTTFKIGGNADIFVCPKNAAEAEACITAALRFKIPYFILGRGSNILVSDKGIEGAVISLSGLDGIEVSGDSLVCGGGASLRSACIAAKNACLSGLEFAYGIPGSVGGAFYMNAGAYGGEISSVAAKAYCLDENANAVTLESKDMQFGYRTSVFKSRKLTVLSAEIRLRPGKKEDISAAMEDYFARRVNKQPLEYPSAGSTFKRPLGYYSGALIEQSGLKGASFGGAQVSEKHAGFIINRAGACANDVLNLIENVKKAVFANSGVHLETEIIFVGRQ